MAAFNPHHGPILEPEEHVAWVRLGRAVPIEPVACAACRAGLLDSGAARATCCALGKATRGHNSVTALLRATAQSCDHTAEMEVPGLILCTDLRPADVLTSALGNAYTALDISICSPHAQKAGPDCTRSRPAAKLDCYGPHLPSLLRQDISYTPIVWSACGRPPPRHVDRFALSVHPSRANGSSCWPFVDFPAPLDTERRCSGNCLCARFLLHLTEAACDDASKGGRRRTIRQET